MKPIKAWKAWAIVINNKVEKIYKYKSNALLNSKLLREYKPRVVRIEIREVGK